MHILLAINYNIINKIRKKKVIKKVDRYYFLIIIFKTTSDHKYTCIWIHISKVVHY